MLHSGPKGQQRKAIYEKHAAFRSKAKTQEPEKLEELEEQQEQRLLYNAKHIIKYKILKMEF